MKWYWFFFFILFIFCFVFNTDAWTLVLQYPFRLRAETLKSCYKYLIYLTKLFNKDISLMVVYLTGSFIWDSGSLNTQKTNLHSIVSSKPSEVRQGVQHIFLQTGHIVEYNIAFLKINTWNEKLDYPLCFRLQISFVDRVQMYLFPPYISKRRFGLSSFMVTPCANVYVERVILLHTDWLTLHTWPQDLQFLWPFRTLYVCCVLFQALNILLVYSTLSRINESCVV